MSTLAVLLCFLGQPGEAGLEKAPELWSFQPIEDPALPAVEDPSWCASPLDRFTRARLEEVGLHPAPAVDRRRLVRRVTFDLTGLPPTPEEIDAFLNDDSPDSYSRLLDRLLASPRYGEKWGRHWLDVARYADSNGMDENLAYVNAFRYRDWVIDAFNEDKPYDRFVTEQIAGDILASDDALSRAEKNALRIATGFLSLGPKMLACDDGRKMELDIIDEQVSTLSQAFLGLTVGCARCHDHKFDPISTVDYYSLAGIFKSTKTMNNFGVVAAWHAHEVVSDEVAARLKAYETAASTKDGELKKFVSDERTDLLARERSKSGEYLGWAHRFVKGSGPIPANGHVSMGDLLQNGSRRQGSWFVEAEDYQEGTLTRDFKTYGTCGVLLGTGFASYDFELPTAGRYQLEIRYASAASRPMRVLLDGETVLKSAAAEITGSFEEDHQRWHLETIFDLTAGKHTLRVESADGPIPHLDKLLLMSIQEGTGDESTLNPGFFRGWVLYLQDVSNGPLAHWPLDGNSSDASGNGRDIASNGNVKTKSEGLGGGALELLPGADGKPSGFLQRTTDDAAFDFGAGDFTISLWANYNDTSGEQVLIEKFGPGAAGPGWSIIKRDDQTLSFWAHGLGDFKGPSRFVADTWHHVAARRSGDSFALFVDGTSIATASLPGSITDSPNPLVLGKRGNGDGRQFFMNGTLDDVAIWSFSLSDADIAKLAARNTANAIEVKTTGLWANGITDATVSDAAAKFDRSVKSWNDALAKDPGIKQLADAKLEAYRIVLYDENGPFALPEKPEGYFDPKKRQHVAQLRQQRAEIEKTKPTTPLAMGVREGKIENLPVHERGNYLTLGQNTERGVPRLLSGVDRPPPDSSSSGRLELAQGIANQNHPLTARIVANRVWLWHFGEGLVRTPDNFGHVGEKPTHPELLDWLSRRLTDSGWSIKSLHRRLLSSSTYRMSTTYDADAYARDPDNRLWWRFPRRRLQVEELRDSILFLGTKLDLAMHGQLMTLKPRAYVASFQSGNVNTDHYSRRSVYLPVLRSATYPIYQAFDFADPSVTLGQRASTTIAPQALFLMNSELVLGSTSHMAKDALSQEQSTDPDRVRTLYQRILGRTPAESEVDDALRFVEDYVGLLRYTGKSDEKPTDARLQAFRGLCRTLVASSEFLYVD